MTNTDPFRLRLLKGLTAVLQGVTPANGFVNDLSTSVYRGRLTFGAKDPLPMIAIIEPPIDDPSKPLPELSTSAYLPYTIMIQGFAIDDPANPTDPAHVLLADVKKAIAAEIMRAQQYNDVVFGVVRRRITKIRMDLGVVRPSDDISSKAFFWLPVRFDMAEDDLRPYDD